MILAIDPGPSESAYAILNKELRPIKFGKVPNEKLLDDLSMDRFVQDDKGEGYCAIEMIASYGMAVGKEVFDTCVWIGRFMERANFNNVKFIYRKEEKMNLCGSMKAKDGNIRQALIDRFGPVGVKKDQGWFYGVSKDVWAAVAVGVTYYDLYIKPKS